MTRTPFLIAGLAVLASACTGTDAVYMEHMSTMESETRGLVLYDDGQRGHAAMWDTTCEFDTLNGWLISDADIAQVEDEVVQDQFEGEVLGRSDYGLHYIQAVVDVEIDNVAHGRMQDSGELAVVRIDEAGDCVADVDGTTVNVTKRVCNAKTMIATDRHGQIFAATGNQLLRISGSGTDSILNAMDFVVYDSSNGMVYAAQKAGAEVFGLSPDGTLQWNVDIGGAVSDLSAMGERGAALAMVETTTGGNLVMIEGHSGEIITEHTTPSDGDITTSDDGRTLAVVLPEQVHFYDVTSEGQVPKARRTLGDPDPTFLD